MRPLTHVDNNFAWVWNSVAKWYIFIPKIPIWACFGGPWNGKCWYMLLPFGILYGHLVDFMSIWFISWSIVIFLARFGMYALPTLATLVWNTS
jgi:hypothetical protein